MNAKLGAEWLSYVTRQPVQSVSVLFTDEQLIWLGERLSSNKLLNPPRATKKPEPKTILVKCKCGCGTVFETTWTTKRPEFLNESHRVRYWRNLKKEALLRAANAAVLEDIKKKAGSGE